MVKIFKRTILHTRILLQYDKNLSYRQNAKQIGCCHKTVKRVVTKALKTGKTEDLPRTGRKKKLSSYNKKQIKKFVINNPKSTLSKIKNELDLPVTLKTISNALHKMGFKAKYIKPKPKLSNKNIKDRKFFHLLYSKKNVNFWKKIIWSDESRFQLNSPNCQIKVWIGPKNKYSIQKKLPTALKYGKFTVHIWACFSKDFRKLVFLDKNVNTKEYIKILQENILKKVLVTSRNEGLIFQQDNATPHTSKKTSKFFLKNNIEKLYWPANSPDLSPIENIFGIIKNKIRQVENKIKTKSEFKSKIKQIFAQIPKKIIENLIESMPKRIKELKKNNYYWINY